MEFMTRYIVALQKRLISNKIVWSWTKKSDQNDTKWSLWSN